MPSESVDQANQSSILVPITVLNFSGKAKEKIEAGGLKKPEHDLLNLLLEYASDETKCPREAHDTHITIPLTPLSDLMVQRSMPGSSLKSLSRKLKTLCELGFFEVVSVPLARGGRPIKKFVLQHIHDADFETQDQRELHERAMGHRNARTQSTKAMLKYLQESEAQLVGYITKGQSLTDSLFTGCFDRCMRFTTSDKVPGNRITSKLRIKRTDVLVQATTQTGLNSQLAALPDQRVIRAIITEVAHFIDNEIERYVLDYDGPKQVSLFDDSNEADSDLYSHVVDEDDSLGEPGQQFESKYQQRRNQIEQWATQQIRNEFYIDTVNVGRRLEYRSPSSSSTRKTLNQSIRRLYDTNFRMMIKSASSKEAVEVMRLFGLSDLVTDFRFISSLKSQYDSDFFTDDDKASGWTPHVAAGMLPVQVEQSRDQLAQNEIDIDPFNPDELKRVRVWRISLDPHLFEMLLDKEQRRLFTAHSQIMKEQSGLAQTIYNFFSQTIGRRNRTALGQKENVFFLKLSELHNILWPTRKYHRFEEEFTEVMKRYSPAWDSSLTLNVSKMFGYQFTLINKAPEQKKPELWIRVERDREDELNGDQSYFNRVLNKVPSVTSA